MPFFPPWDTVHHSETSTAYPAAVELRSIGTHSNTHVVGVSPSTHDSGPNGCSNIDAAYAC